MIGDYILAFREIKKQIAEKRKKDAMYRVLVGTELNYMIIKDLVNAAVHDVKIAITTKDGTHLEITRLDPFDKLRGRSPDPEQRY